MVRSLRERLGVLLRADLLEVPLRCAVSVILFVVQLGRRHGVWSSPLARDDRPPGS